MPMPDAALLDTLRAHATLGAVPEAELAWLAEHGLRQHFPIGALLTKAGGPPPAGLYILFSGLVVIHVDRGNGAKKVMEWRGGDVTGALPYSRMVSPPGDTVAMEPIDALMIPQSLIREMTRECHEVTGVLVHKMIDRARVFEQSQRHDEKMVSLGKLSAGLAHELNNPAAAIERSATLLEDRLDEAERATLALGAARLNDAQLSAVEHVRAVCLAKPPVGVLSPLQQAEREDSISDWLADHGMDERLSGPLADTAVTLDALNAIAAAVSGSCLDAVLHWAAAGCAVRSIASEIQDAASRISGLVAAVKGFTHMDQGGPAGAVDLPVTIGNTVAVLKAKARAKAVAVTLDFEPSLPQAVGHAGELNQVWANLIDNALDAVNQGGHVVIQARRELERVAVCIVDDGPGIPPEVRERIFDPFFTTKGVGKGTGLGLDIVNRLIMHNDARIDVESRPGRTQFKVTLPVHAGQAGAPS